MYKTKFDDGFHMELTNNAFFDGNPPMPMLMALNNTEVPKALVPFSKIRTAKTKRAYVHFYQHDKAFAPIFTATDRYLEKLKEFDGVISPDPTLIIGQPIYLQQTNTYLNRSVAFKFQEVGIPVLPNIRWSDETSFDFFCNGIPTKIKVAISTHGCIHSKELAVLYKKGLEEMIKRIEPTDVIVHGRMPENIFGDYVNDTNFHRFPSEFEMTHSKRDA